jgi:hypothetical protein
MACCTVCSLHGLFAPVGPTPPEYSSTVRCTSATWTRTSS